MGEREHAARRHLSVCAAARCIHPRPVGFEPGPVSGPLPAPHKFHCFSASLCGGLYPVFVLCACFIAASASFAVNNGVDSKWVKAPVAAAVSEHAAATVESGNSQ